MKVKKETLKHEVINKLGAISKEKSGWKKQLTRVSWNAGEPKYDIRSWNEDYTKMGKGITLTEEELKELKKLIDKEVEFLNEE